MPTLVPSGIHMAQAAALLGKMANVKRLLILEIISKEEMSVGVLAIAVDLSQSALSQHLSKLRSSKLVHTRRDAQTVFYRCDSMEVKRILTSVQECFGVAEQQPMEPQDKENRKEMSEALI